MLEICEQNNAAGGDYVFSENPELTSRPSRIGSLMGVKIAGIGSCVPANVVRNEDLAALGYDADWILQRTGILERRHLPPGMATSDLAVGAAQECLNSAGVSAEDVDLLLLGTYSPDLNLPATACFVQHRLGLRCPAFDMAAACASFAYGLVTGMQFVKTGNCKNVLVIGADCNSRICNPSDKKTYPLFGDAGGAVLLQPGDTSQGALSYALGVDGEGAKLLWRPMGGSLMPYDQDGGAHGLQYLHMNGKPVFKWAIRMLQDTIREVLDHSGKKLDDVNLVIFHQANVRIINTVAKGLKLDPDRVFVNLDQFGNTASASIPLALDQAYDEGKISKGDLVLFSGFGAGLAWGTILLEW